DRNCSLSPFYQEALMSIRILSLSALVLTLSMAPAVHGQAKKTWTAPLTPDGRPDLQGIWNNSTITPLERPADLAGEACFTAVEAAAFEKQTLQTGNADRRDGGADADVGRAYNEFWRTRGGIVSTLRTSLVIDPPDGRIPPLTPEAQKRNAAQAEY